MTVSTLSFDNVVEIVSVMADAFHDYPVMRFVLGPESPGAPPYPVRLHRLVQLFVSARAYRGEPLMGVRDDGGALIGAAVISLMPGSPDALPAFIAASESIWAELGTEARARYDAYASAANFFDDFAPHHHLNMIGVRRVHQGLGISRELLAAVHEFAERDARSAGTSLTTERVPNIALYEHFGYRVHAHARVSSDLETWGMFRPRVSPP